MRLPVGMVRKVDEVGRIVIPAEIRRKFKWKWDDSFSFLMQGDEVVIELAEDSKVMNGIERRMDRLGRVVIPRENRKILKWVENETNIEFFIEGRKIVVKEYKPGCTFCGSLDIEKTHNGKYVCSYCVGVLRG